MNIVQRRLLVPLAIVVVAAIVYFLVSANLTPPGLTGKSEGLRPISLASSTVLVKDQPMDVYVGSFTGKKAVIQVSEPASAGASLSSMRSSATLTVDGKTIQPTQSESRLGNGSFAVTFTFVQAEYFGRSILNLIINGHLWHFLCNWPNFEPNP